MQGRPLLILATTSSLSVLQQLEFDFKAHIAVPNITKQKELGYVMHESKLFSQTEIEQCLQEIQATTGRSDLSIGIDTALTAITTAQHSQNKLERFAEIVSEAVARSIVD